jgi:orotidine 5'-phosphate decarboxylase subfamily 2
MSFFSRLETRARAIDSLLCIGLDPHPELVGAAGAAATRDWCRRLIEATAAVACAFKPNAAFFEDLGAEGWTALQAVVEARRHAPVILDVKRGDIASTAQAYAHSAFDRLGADAVTLSAYLGRDSVEPFLAQPEHGVFLLCKTSNPGADDLQTETLASGETIYLRVARLAADWNGGDNVGLVVGATDPAALEGPADGAGSLDPGAGRWGARWIDRDGAGGRAAGG